MTKEKRYRLKTDEWELIDEYRKDKTHFTEKQAWSYII